MSNLLNRLNRVLSKQRTISLFEDQEAKIDKLNAKYNLKLKYGEIVREGVDLVLTQIEMDLKDKGVATNNIYKL